MKRPIVLCTSAILAATGLAACGDSSGTGAGGGDGKVTVVTGAYPLEYAIQRVGGDLVEVTNLTQAGGDPHDLELTPRQVGQIQDANLVVHLEGFQPALDDAVSSRDGSGVLEVSQAAQVMAAPQGEGSADGHDHEHGEEEHAGHDHGEEGHDHGEEGHEGHDHGPNDPHFWLDPMRLASTGEAIAEQLAAVDETNAETYRKNAAALESDLRDLDEQYRTGLATCTSRDLVTAHEAFGYLAAKYDLRQIGIAGINPEAEPSPRQLADIVSHVREANVDTVYTEVLVSPAVARTVADEAGVQTAVLDPLEGLTSQNADEDYLSIMTENLQTLRTGQGCS